MNFIEGITILNIINHYGASPFFEIFGILSYGIVPISIVIIVVILGEKDLRNIKILCISIICLLIGIGGLYKFTYENNHRFIYTSYQCSLDNSLNVEEFAEKYKVIEQHGKIFEIVIKDAE